METVENKYITLAYKLYSIENGEKDDNMLNNLVRSSSTRQRSKKIR